MATTVTPPAEGEKAATALPSVQQKDPQLEAMRAELARLTGTVQRLQPAASSLSTAGQPLDKKELTKKFYDDPLTSTAAIADAVVRNAAMANGAATYDTNVENARRLAREGNEALWDEYANEINGMVMYYTDPANGGNPLARQNVHIWRNAFAQVKGQNIDAILSKKGQSRGDGNQSAAVHISDDGGPAGASRGAPTSGSAKLSADELQVARGLGLSPEQYQVGKIRYENQNHKPKEKSSWDEVITFDTQAKRRAARAAKSAGK